MGSRDQFKKGMPVPNEMPAGSERLLKSLPIDEFGSILDLGTGNGFAANYLATLGKSVYASSIGIDHWNVPRGDAVHSNRVEFLQATAEDIPFRDGVLDAVWASHVLEHIVDVGLALKEIRRVLTDDGFLFVSVPPFKPLVVGGHVHTGWTPGQLLYLLVVHGFDGRGATVGYFGYNVHARVRKLPEEDYEQIQRLRTYDGNELDNLCEYFPEATQRQIRSRGAYSGIVELSSERDGLGRENSTSLRKSRTWFNYLKHALTR